MTIQPGAMLYTQGFGSRPEGVEVPHIETRPPTYSDNIYDIGKRWVDTAGGIEYCLTSYTYVSGIKSANWAFLGAAAGDLNTLTTEDAVVVTPTAGNIDVIGTGSTTTTGAGDTVTVSLTGLTNHNVLIGAGTATITKVAPSATSGVALVSAGAAADPIFGTVSVAGGGTGVTSITAHDLIVGNGTSAVTLLAPSATSGVPLISQGAAADPAYGTAVVAGGGTGAVTLTGVLTGNGTSAVTANAVTEHGVVLGGASNAVSSLAVAATGTVLTGVTGADPAFTATPSGLTSITATSFITSSATVGTTFTNNSLTPTGSDANIDLLVNGKGTGGVIQSRGLVGGDITMEATNTDNTNGASRAGFEAAVGGTSAGDAYFQSLISGGQVFSWGIDNSTANDDWVLSKSATLGTSNQLSIDGTSGALLTVAGITAGTGNITATAGAVNAGTSMTATLGDITATNGNLSLATAGNKIVIATGANASVGTSAAMSGTPGAVTVATTASSATAKIFYARATTGGTAGQVSITAQDGTGFTLTSDANETSTFNWWIINA